MAAVLAFLPSLLLHYLFNSRRSIRCAASHRRHFWVMTPCNSKTNMRCLPPCGVSLMISSPPTSPSTNATIQLFHLRWVAYESCSPISPMSLLSELDLGGFKFFFGCDMWYLPEDVGQIFQFGSRHGIRVLPKIVSLEWLSVRACVRALEKIIKPLTIKWNCKFIKDSRIFSRNLSLIQNIPSSCTG